MTAPVRFPRFFVTSPAPCPYLPGRSERKVFTELKGAQAETLNDALSRIGFRRSQNVAYRPSCLDCHACVSVRVVADEFVRSSTQKRNLKRNSDLVATLRKPWATPEQFELLRTYLGARHPGGGMTAMDESDFADRYHFGSSQVRRLLTHLLSSPLLHHRLFRCHPNRTKSMRPILRQSSFLH